MNNSKNSPTEEAKFTVVIPARYASSRLPGKPLLDIAGMSMVQRVYQQCLSSEAVQVVIATDDARIESVAQSFGARVCMTRADHDSGTDRIQEVAEQLALADDDIIVNVQGDEPLIPPALINQVALNLSLRPDVGISTLCESIGSVSTLFDPNAVKVVFDSNGRALYFSRAPIPWHRDEFSGVFSDEGRAVKAMKLPSSTVYYRHIGIYGYRVSFLHSFVQWPPAPTEQTECLEQLRAMYNAVPIHVEEALEKPQAGVDTLADLDLVRSILAGNQEPKSDSK